MSDHKPQPIEELWWEVTTANGLTLALPAPLSVTSVSKAIERRAVVESESAITGRRYYLAMADILLVKQYTMTGQSERYQQALKKLLGLSSESASSYGQGATSPSDDTENPSGPSTGARIRRDIH